MLRGPLLGVAVFAAAWLLFSLFWAYGSLGHAKERIANSEYLRSSNLFDIKNETLGFARIFVASLPERSDKRDAMAIAASLSGMSIEWVDGVDGSKVPEKAIPESWSKDETNNTLGCWRVHMNIAQKIVREHISTALVLEDDADWDVNLKAQLLEFARGTRYVLNQESKSTHSPYGDGWDNLWVGHCGARNREELNQRYWVIRDDPTAVPLDLWGYPRRQPNLTPPALNGTYNRVVYQPVRGLCMFGYALSLEGARRMLQDQAQVQALPSDRALNRLCTHAGGMCLAPYPTLIGTHKAAGSTNKDSDREKVTGKVREKGVTGQIVFSTRLNFKSLIEEGKKGLVQSQWPDKTLLKEINGTVDIPRGEGVFVTKDEYSDFPRPN